MTLNIKFKLGVLLSSIFLTLAPIPSGAQSGGGAAPAPFYMPLIARENDVFVFCKYGDPNYGGWQPVSSAQGTFTVTNYYMYIYGRGIYTSAQYMMVCPIGGGPGNWTPGGSDSTGENTAYTGSTPITFPH